MTEYRFFSSDDQVDTGVTGPPGSMLWGVEVDFSDFGIPAGASVDAIRVKGDCATSPPQAELDLVMVGVLSAGCGCDDGNECTMDVCDEDGACSHMSSDPRSPCS